MHLTHCHSLPTTVLTVAMLAAQSPPPTGAVANVGTVNQTQPGGPLGDQRIGAICAAQFYGANPSIGIGGVVPGGSIAWWSEAIHPTTQPATYHQAGITPVFFLVAPFAAATLQLPFAAPLHNRLFLPPLGTVILAAPWTQTLTTGGGGQVPAGGFDRWFLTLDVPNSPAFLGSVWASQAVRIDPSDLRLYFSDEHLVQVSN
jgi:hypothetical protein